MNGAHVDLAYLVRHAKAEAQAKGSGGDAARHLTPEGRTQFRALTTALAPKLSVARIVTSPFTRALETAEILSKATGAPIEEEEQLASGQATGRALLELLRRSGPGVALVGHNPEIAEAIALASERNVHVKAGAVAAIDLERAPSTAALVWFEAPGRDDR